jgi:hypothetical protein
MNVEMPDGTIIEDVPEGTTKEQLFSKYARYKPGDKKPAREQNALADFVDVVHNMASSMVAKPVSEVAGLGAIPLHAAGLIDTEPQDIKDKVQGALTSDLPTERGERWAQNNPVALIGKVIDYVGEKAGGLVKDESQPEYAPRNMAGNAIHEGVNQGASFLGVKKGADKRAALPGKQAALDAQKTIDTPVNEIRAASQEAGYITPAERGAKATVSRLSNDAANKQIISAGNEINATKRLGNEVGVLDGKPMTPEVLDAAEQPHIQKYRDMEKAAGPEVPVTEEVATSLIETSKKLAEPAQHSPAQYAAAQKIVDWYTDKLGLRHTDSQSSPPVQGTINEQLAQQPGPPIVNLIEQVAGEQPHAFTGTGGLRDSRPHGGAQMMEGDPPYFMAGKTSGRPAPFSAVSTPVVPKASSKWLTDQISQLRKDAKLDYQRGDGVLANTRMGIANQLENMLESAIGKEAGPQAMAEFRDARKALAKIHVLGRVVNDQTGLVDLRKLHALSETPAYKGVLDGEFKTAADFAGTYGKAAQPGQSSSVAAGLGKLDLLWGLGGAMASIAHPGFAILGGAKVALDVGGPLAAKHGLLQNKGPRSYELSAMQQSTPALLQSLGLLTAGEEDTNRQRVSLRSLINGN